MGSERPEHMSTNAFSEPRVSRYGFGSASIFSHDELCQVPEMSQAGMDQNGLTCEGREDEKLGQWPKDRVGNVPSVDGRPGYEGVLNGGGRAQEILLAERHG